LRSHTGDQTQPQHQSQHAGTIVRRRYKAHIRKCQPMAYIMMVVRSSRWHLQYTPDPQVIPILVSAKLQREPQHCELNIIGQKAFIQNVFIVYKIDFQG
jgi:hypothetical protein